MKKERPAAKTDNLSAQKKLTAEYLTGKIDIDTYKTEMNKVTVPLNLTALASKIKFKLF